MFYKIDFRIKYSLLLYILLIIIYYIIIKYIIFIDNNFYQ